LRLTGEAVADLLGWCGRRPGRWRGVGSLLGSICFASGASGRWLWVLRKRSWRCLRLFRERVGLPFGAGGEGGGEGEGEQFGSISVPRAWFDRVATRLLSIEVGEGCLGVGSLLLTFASLRSSPFPSSGSLARRVSSPRTCWCEGGWHSGHVAPLGNVLCVRCRFTHLLPLVARCRASCSITAVALPSRAVTELPVEPLARSSPPLFL